jgi:hypothetical protein
MGQHPGVGFGRLQAGSSAGGVSECHMGATMAAGFGLVGIWHVGRSMAGSQGWAQLPWDPLPLIRGLAYFYHQNSRHEDRGMRLEMPATRFLFRLAAPST